MLREKVLNAGGLFSVIIYCIKYSGMFRSTEG